MIFENSLPKANFGQNIRDSPNGSLTADSRSLQTATLKRRFRGRRRRSTLNSLLINEEGSKRSLELETPDIIWGKGNLPLWFFASFLSLYGKTILCPQSLNYIIYMALVISQLTMLKLEKAIFGLSTIFAP